jgi:hypothetical protein
MINKRALLNLSFALIWLDFPLLYYGAAVVRDPWLAGVALVVIVLAVAAALFT